MTLALLLTAVTGAWAEEKMVTINSSTESSGAVTATGFNISNNYLYVSKNPATITTSEGVITKLVIKKYDGTYGHNLTEANVGVTPGTITYGSDEIIVKDINAESVTLSRKGGSNWSTSSVDVYYGAPATFPFPITWDATNKTTGFSQPAGNVFMNVEYYPTAALTAAPAAKSDIKATTDDAIVTAGTVANIGLTENAQGTLMYYAVQSETAPDAPDYDNQGWSDQVPTAADFNQGNVYVWYYVKGADGDETSTFNDGAITKLGESGYVTLAAAPTYAITLKEDTEEADKWTISSAKAIKGTTITATYSGERKVKSVKAVKKNTAYAANEYNEASWDGTKVVFTKQTAASDPTAVANSDAAVTWDAGWYTVSGNVTITGNVTLTADAHLILQDGATLTINGYLNCRTNGKNLYIYGQKKGDGKLNVTSNGANAINSNINLYIYIHGGEVTASAADSYGLYTGYLAVYGGKLTATSGGSNGIHFQNTIDVYGGEVVATSNATSDAHYGIRSSGSNAANQILTVYGGKVTATGNGKNGMADYGSGFSCYVKSGTSGIKFYFSADGTTWGDGTSYASATKVGNDDATKKRYAKAE